MKSKIIAYALLSVLIVGIGYGGYVLYDKYKTYSINKGIEGIVGVGNRTKLDQVGNKEGYGYIPSGNSSYIVGELVEKQSDIIEQSNIVIKDNEYQYVIVVNPVYLENCEIDSKDYDGYACWEKIFKDTEYKFECTDLECNNIKSVKIYDKHE